MNGAIRQVYLLKRGGNLLKIILIFSLLTKSNIRQAMQGFYSYCFKGTVSGASSNCLKGTVSQLLAIVLKGQYHEL